MARLIRFSCSTVSALCLAVLWGCAGDFVDGLLVLRFSVSLVDLYYSSYGYDTSRIRREEERHIRQYQRGEDSSSRSAHDLTAKVYPGLSECEEACSEWKKKTRNDLESTWSQWWIDFTHPPRDCKGYLVW